MVGNTNSTPNGNIYPVMQDIIGSGAQDLTQLLYRPGKDPDDIRGRKADARDDSRGSLIQILQYVIENLIYHITEIMPKTGVLGTHKKAGIFEMIKSGKRFSDGYFWQIEIDRLTFDGSGRTTNVGNFEAFILIIGIFLSRSFITTPMPGEVARYVYADEEMRAVHLRLRRTYEYSENLLREWGAEYIKRLRQAGSET